MMAEPIKEPSTNQITNRICGTVVVLRSSTLVESLNRVQNIILFKFNLRVFPIEQLERKLDVRAWDF